jgi:hypothetical protein
MPEIIKHKLTYKIQKKNKNKILVKKRTALFILSFKNNEKKILCNFFVHLQNTYTADNLIDLNIYLG